MSNRRRGREHVLKALYAFELGSQTKEQIVETILDNGSLDGPTLDFARQLFEKSVEFMAGIDERNNKALLSFTSRLKIPNKFPF